MTVGFLFNHDQVHQLRHGLPVAMAVARRGRLGEIVVLTGSPRMTAAVRDIVGADHPRLVVRELRLGSVLAKALDAALGWLVPTRKLAIYRDNLDAFRALDVLVVTEKTSTMLKTRYGLDRLRLVHTRHGAGDRAIGFDAASGIFDLVLVAGPAIRERLITDAALDPRKIAVVGYPKFDLAPASHSPVLFAHPERPTVLYNPHVAPHLSSWYRDGAAVLDFFARNPQYNLIFAPHVMMFERPVTVTIDPPRVRLRGAIPQRILAAPNIHVDLSSVACTDMTYTRMADIYLGDVSSQVYEFLAKPRPCLFLDSHRTNGWASDPSFAHWHAGEVIGSVDSLGPALECAVADPDRYRAAQTALFDSHIELTAVASSNRAAEAIERMVLGKATLAEPAQAT